MQLKEKNWKVFLSYSFKLQGKFVMVTDMEIISILTNMISEEEKVKKAAPENLISLCKLQQLVCLRVQYDAI